MVSRSIELGRFLAVFLLGMSGRNFFLVGRSFDVSWCHARGSAQAEQQAEQGNQ